MANLKDVIYLSNTDFETLVANGTVTINGTTLTYDENSLYITPDELATTSSAGLMPALNSSSVSTQSQSTKFLREDGTWAAPSYTSSITDTNYYPTSFSWTGGTTSGPTGTLSGTGMSNVSFGAIPSASDSASGIVTTGTQVFAGAKQFDGYVNIAGTYLGINQGSIKVGGSQRNKMYSITLDCAGSDTSGQVLTLPDETGTLATQTWVGNQGYLTSHQDLSNYVTLNTEQTITGVKTIGSSTTSTNFKIAYGDLVLDNVSGSISGTPTSIVFANGSTTYHRLKANTSGVIFSANMTDASGGANYGFYLTALTPTNSNSLNLGRSYSSGNYGRWANIYMNGDIKKYNGTSGTTEYTLTLQNKTGTIALTSDIPTKISDLTNDSNFEVTTNKTGILSSQSTSTQYPNAEAVYQSIKNVMDVAEGKTRTFVTVLASYTQSGESSPRLYILGGESGTTKSVGDSISYSTSGIGHYEITAATTDLDLSSLDEWYCVEYKSGTGNNTVYEITYVISGGAWSGSNDTAGEIKTGDNLLIVNTNVPDYWFTDTTGFNLSQLETAKIDLSSYVTVDTEQEISGTKILTNNVYLKGKTTTSSNYQLIGLNTSNIVSVGDTSTTIRLNGSSVSSSGINPYGNNYDLGNSNAKWKNLYLSGNLTDGTNSISVANIGTVKSVTITTSGTGLSINDSTAITTSGSRTITLDSSSAGNATANKVVLRNADGSIQTEKVAISSGTTTKATIQYDTTNDCIKFVFA